MKGIDHTYIFRVYKEKVNLSDTLKVDKLNDQAPLTEEDVVDSIPYSQLRQKETDGSLVCEIVVEIDNSNKAEPEKASLKVISEKDMPVLLTLGKRESEQLLYFLKSRVFPSNRCRLEKMLEPYGVDVDDWIGKMQINDGRVHDDNYFIKVERK